MIWVLIGGTLLWLLALGPAVLLAMMSPMAGDSGVTAATWVFVIGAFTFPVALLVCPALAWTAYGFRRSRAALILLLLPLLWPVAMVWALFTAGLGE